MLLNVFFFSFCRIEPPYMPIVSKLELHKRVKITIPLFLRLKQNYYSVVKVATMAVSSIKLCHPPSVSCQASSTRHRRKGCRYATANRNKSLISGHKISHLPRASHPVSQTIAHVDFVNNMRIEVDPAKNSDNVVMRRRKGA